MTKFTLRRGVVGHTQLGQNERVVLTAALRVEIGNILRSLRRAQKLKQRAVAKRAGLAAGTVSMIERGIGRDSRPENIDAVARVLGTSLDELEARGKEIAVTQPLEQRLNEEALTMARRYQLASTGVRLAIGQLLEGGQAPITERPTVNASAAPGPPLPVAEIAAALTLLTRLRALEPDLQRIVTDAYQFAENEAAKRPESAAHNDPAPARQHARRGKGHEKAR